MFSKCLTNATENFLGCQIDQNLTVTQGIMAFINTVDTADDPIIESKIDKAKWFAGVGSAGPGVVAGTMLIMYRIAIALFVGFAPMFILSLLFKKTAPLFQKWLYFGIATIFSSVMLGVMAQISTDLVSEVAGSLFVSSKLLSAVGVGSSNLNGLMEATVQQLGLGLVLSTLLITVPPMAGMWFNGMMSSYSGYNALAGWGGGKPAVMPGHNDYSQQVENRTLPTVGQSERSSQTNNQLANNYHNLGVTNGGINSNTQHSDAIKPQSQMRQEQTATTVAYTQPSTAIKQGENTDKTKENKGEQA